jgi:type II restriction enzyme
MRYNEVANEIVKLIEENKNFAESGILIEQSLNQCSVDDILGHLDYGGMIPEMFQHDSSEEKVFAKYCDALFARSLNELGLESQVLVERADAADVAARCDARYTLVGDAKAFRLSRTAKNQKDFKVESLHKWKKGADYACLLAPIYQLPTTNSQIYSQATRFNVTLLSYTHLAFLIRNKNFSAEDLERLWGISATLPEGKGAITYWETIRDAVLDLTRKTKDDWQDVVRETRERLAEQAVQQISFWEEKTKQYASVDHDTAVKLLVKALKIDSKIAEIKKLARLK